MENLVIDIKDAVLTISYKGELSLNCTEEFKSTVQKILDGHIFEVVVFDLGDVTFLDSSGIGFLVSINNRIRQSGTLFYLYALSPRVEKILKLINLYSFFDIIGDEDELLTIIP